MRFLPLPMASWWRVATCVPCYATVAAVAAVAAVSAAPTPTPASVAAAAAASWLRLVCLPRDADAAADFAYVSVLETQLGVEIPFEKVATAQRETLGCSCHALEGERLAAWVWGASKRTRVSMERSFHSSLFLQTKWNSRLTTHFL